MAMVPKLNTTQFEGEIPFKVIAPFEPMGDQPQAIADLVGGIKSQITGAGFFSNNMIQEELICSK